jgi:hypothetical protein
MQDPFSSNVAKDSSFNLLLRHEVSSPPCATVLRDPRKSKHSGKSYSQKSEVSMPGFVCVEHRIYNSYKVFKKNSYENPEK